VKVKDIFLWWRYG